MKNEMTYTIKEHKEKKLMSGDDLIESVGVVVKVKPEAAEMLRESSKGKKKRKLIVQMEAIHVGRTANYTYYTEEGLKAGLESWTKPYNKPVLTHHNQHNGEPIGRILRAEFSDSTMSGRKGLIFTCEITDPDAIEKVLDGRYSTVSIGATTDKVICNICGTDRTKEWCDHWKGEEYDGQTCHYIIGTTYGREVSYVNVPSDENAGNFSISIEDEDETSASSKESESTTLQIFQIAEGLMQSAHLPEVNLYESASDDVKELIDGLLEKEERSVPKVKYTVNEQGQIIDDKGQVIEVEEMQKLQNDLTEAKTRISELEKDLQEAQSTLSKVVIEKSKVDSLLTEKEEEIVRLAEENAQLIEKAHRALAEKVVDMKLTLRKSDVIGVSREEAIAEHIKRSEESLQDTVKDLQIEMSNSNIVRGTVPNPGAQLEDNNPNNMNEKEEPKMTIEDGINLFKGMFGRKQ